MRWFKHMTDALMNKKLSAVESESGLEGIGFWWRIMEVVGSQIDENLQTFAEHSAKTWGNFCGISAKKFQKLADILAKHKMIILINSEKSVRIDIPNILKYLDETTKKKIRNSGNNPETIEKQSGQDQIRSDQIRTDKIRTKNNPPNPPEGASEDKNKKQTDSLHEQIVKKYHETLPDLAKFQIWGSKDALNLKHNVQIDPIRGSPDFWENVFIQASLNNFLQGRTPHKKRGQWKASLSWLLVPDNATAVINGKYPPDKKAERKKDYGTTGDF